MLERSVDPFSMNDQLIFQVFVVFKPLSSPVKEAKGAIKDKNIFEVRYPKNSLIFCQHITREK